MHLTRLIHTFIQILSPAVISLAAPAPQAGLTPSLSGNAVVLGSGTYPRATRLSDGSLLGVYTAFNNGNTILTTVKSTNNGASWAALGTITTVTTATHDTDNPFVLQLPSGAVLAAFRNHDKTNNQYTFYRITVCKSTDLGQSWTFLSTPAQDPGVANTGLWEPFLRNALDGSVQIYYSCLNNANDQDSLIRTSTDGGLNWSSATTISGAEFSNVRDGMLGVATISGSNLIAVFESLQNGLFTVNSITSSDDGKTWGNRQRVYAPTGSNNNAGAPQIVGVGGTLVVSFMTDEDTSQHQWVQGADVKIVTSGDGGKTWGHKLTVSGVQSNWPGLVGVDSGSFLVLADNGGAKSQRVNLS